MATQPSLLDDLGEEVTGIMAPVSLCMAVTVLLVRLLNPEGASSSNSVLIASIAYQENASDSSGKKLGGALLNAIIFVAVIAGMTVVLFLLFKYKCYKFIYAYMGFAVFNIFFFLTGALFIQVMQVINLHIDAFSLAYGLFNFSIVGTLGLLFVPIPLLLKQIYLIWVGIIVAYIFTFIPEWTSWVILVFMALYDIAAVLIPGGPLKALVELAIERKQDLPALIYEARPAGGRPYVRGWGNREPREQPDGGAGSAAPRPVAEAAGAASLPPGSLEMRRPASRGSRPSSAGSAGGGGGAAMSGGWVNGPSRMSLATAAAEPAALPRGGGWPGQGQEGDAGPPGDSVRSFGSHQGLEPQHQHQQGLQQPRRLGTGGGAAAALGPRPVAEGRELDGTGDGEGEAWEPLPSQGGGGGGGGILRGRLSQVLSAASPRGGDPAGGGGDASSHTSQEPLIESPSSTAAEKQKQQQRQSSSAAAAGSGLLLIQPRASGTAGPSNPAAASPGSAAGGAGSRGGSPAGKAKPGLEASPSQQQRLAAAGGSGCLRDESMMGVRAVAPALSGEQLAEAVRRSTRGPGDLQPLQQPPGPPAVAPGGERRGPDGEDGEAFEHDLPDAIKLGLGDFIFYSMLVGRAAMYDYMTVFSSYLAIIAGLGLTLLCLAIYQKALPALPFSIALGVAFYFLTRLTLEPFLVPLSVHMTYY